MSSDLKTKKTKPRGLLNEASSLQHFKLDLYEAPKGLEEVVSQVWHVHWDLADGQTYRQSNVPHPVQHIVLDLQRGSGFKGCVTKRFDYDISGKGQVLGFKIEPGMGRICLPSDMSDIKDDAVPLAKLIGEVSASQLEGDLRNDTPIQTLVENLGQSLAEVMGDITPAMRQAREAVQMIETSKEIFTATALSSHLNLNLRNLQRLFSSHVGVSPKWVIDRYRMLEALDVMNSDRDVNLAELALNLEYFDQSHFTRKFKAMTGVSPSAYLKQVEQ